VKMRRTQWDSDKTTCAPELQAHAYSAHGDQPASVYSGCGYDGAVAQSGQGTRVCVECTRRVTYAVGSST